MADDIERTEETAGPENDSGNPPEGGEREPDREVTELEQLVTQKDEKIINISRRLDELEEALAGKEEEISALRQTAGETEERLTSLNNSLGEAVASYKGLVIQANPEVVEELITGDTIESIKKSLEQARNLVSKVRQGLETEISLAKVPAGAPERTSPDLSALSPREKIQYAVSRVR